MDFGKIAFQLDPVHFDFLCTLNILIDDPVNGIKVQWLGYFNEYLQFSCVTIFCPLNIDVCNS